MVLKVTVFGLIPFFNISGKNFEASCRWPLNSIILSCSLVDIPVKSGGNIWLHGGRVLSERVHENLRFLWVSADQFERKMCVVGWLFHIPHFITKEEEQTENLNVHARAYFFLPT